MALANYLNADVNLHARAELLNYRLLFDTELAAAACGYHLLTYYSDVDHDGFDIIVDDRPHGSEGETEARRQHVVDTQLANSSLDPAPQ